MPTDPITITQVALTHNPAPFTSKMAFTFTFEAAQLLTGPLEWKITYVGSAKDESYDQILQEFEINSIQLNKSMMFTVECNPPNFEKIPRKQLLSITAIIITVGYKQQQFIRIGYYVHLTTNKEINQKERGSMSAKELVNYLTRTILINKPRITKFTIDWGNQKESSNSLENMNHSPVKNEKTDHSNSLLSISKTSCNQKQSYQVNLSPHPSLKKKQKKIKKSALKSQL